jgi:hypothetical protein
MKALKAICVAAVFALCLSTSASAENTDPGIIHTPGVTSPGTGNGSTSLPGDSGSASVTFTELGDVSSSALTDTLWIMLSIF